MALWLVRAGKNGEYEQKFLEESMIYLCWERLDADLSQVPGRKSLRQLLQRTYPKAKPGRITQNSGQIWAFAKKMKPGDWVAVPSKFSPSIHVGEIAGEYKHHPEGPGPYYHSRSIRWIEQDIPRTNFDQDVLYSLGAFSTICEVKRNNAESRIREMAKLGWKAGVTPVNSPPTENGENEAVDSAEAVDLEQQAKDQITRHIIAKFKGHGLARLVGRILKAQGYTIHQPPEGPDRGIDLLAAPGALGFGEPRIVVQVKSQDSPVDRPTLDQLVGTMSNLKADFGLLVSWSGFKNTVKREEAQQFFRVRLWDSGDIIDGLFSLYDQLDDDLQTEIPLKRLWILATPEENETGDTE